MKILFLLRHAKAEPGSKDLDDKERPLSARGREACLAIGTYMKKKHYMPVLALSSPALRTRETYARIMEASGGNPINRIEDRLYLATAGEILHNIQKINDDVPNAIIIGHNPGMHHASLMLADIAHTPLRVTLELKYPTGSLAMLRFNREHWAQVAPGEGELVDFITPGQL